jgi:hypothetical protein
MIVNQKIHIMSKSYFSQFKVFWKQYYSFFVLPPVALFGLVAVVYRLIDAPEYVYSSLSTIMLLAVLFLVKKNLESKGVHFSFLVLFIAINLISGVISLWVYSIDILPAIKNGPWALLIIFAIACASSFFGYILKINVK